MALIGDRIHGLTSKWSGTNMSGLDVWSSDHLTIRNTVFDHNANRNIAFVGGSTESNGLFENNVFAPAVYDQDPTQKAPGGPIPDNLCQDAMGGSGASASSFTAELWRYNTFVQCWILGGPGSYFGVRMVGNLIGGEASCLPQTGIGYDHNAAGNGSACGGGVTIQGDPFASRSSGDFRLAGSYGESLADNYVPCSSGDAQIGFDIDGTRRPQHTNCTAGAYER
jgi:hypothetical protein